MVKEVNKATSANQYGFYSLTVPKGKYTIVFTLLGYKTYTQSIDLDKNISINVNLNSAEKQLGEVEVTTDKPDQNIKSTQMSSRKFPRSWVRLTF